MDIYIPDNDTLTERPVVIYPWWCYINRSKNNTDCVDFCSHFIKRGHVAIAANGLSNNPIFIDRSTTAI